MFFHKETPWSTVLRIDTSYQKNPCVTLHLTSHRAALLLAHRAENPAVEESARKLCAYLRPRAPPVKAGISPIHWGFGGSKEQISGFESEFASKLIMVGNHPKYLGITKNCSYQKSKSSWKEENKCVIYVHTPRSFRFQVHETSFWLGNCFSWFISPGPSAQNIAKLKFHRFYIWMYELYVWAQTLVHSGNPVITILLSGTWT